MNYFRLCRYDLYDSIPDEVKGFLEFVRTEPSMQKSDVQTPSLEIETDAEMKEGDPPNKILSDPHIIDIFVISTESILTDYKQVSYEFSMIDIKSLTQMKAGIYLYNTYELRVYYQSFLVRTLCSSLVSPSDFNRCGSPLFR